MRRRQHIRNTPLTQNLDSFLDVLTNTVGVLMFVSLFMSLVAAQTGKSSVTISTPLVSETKKQPRFFELRNNQITYIDDRLVDRQIQEVLGESVCQKPNKPANISTDIFAYDKYVTQVQQYQTCSTRQAKRIKNFRPKTSYYEVRLVDYQKSAWLYKPIEGVRGESIEELTKTKSQFNSVLQKLDPTKEYLAFVVRPDSFAAFRQAREQALKKGFNVGWEPQSPEVPIVFGSGGRNIGVQ